MNKAKKAGTVVISVLLWVIILIAALYSITVLANKDGNNVASVAGFTPLVVQSDSMAPTFCKADYGIFQGNPLHEFCLSYDWFTGAQEEHIYCKQSSYIVYGVGVG